MLTSLLSSAETVHIHCTVEVFDDRRQFFIHFFERLLVDRPTRRSRCFHQHLSNPGRRPTMFDVVARHFCNIVHHFIHPWDDLVQQIRLFTHDVLRHNIRERQDVL